MNRLTIDLETRSRVNLSDRGLYVYAEDPSTDVLCVAFKMNDAPAKIFVPSEKWIRVLLSADNTPEKEYVIRNLITATTAVEWVADADETEAHNVNFERQLWHHVIHKKYGLPDLPTHKLRCSAAKAATTAIPRDLKGACNVLGTFTKKDDEGYRVMMKMCNPRKPTKGNPSEWHEDPNDFVKLCLYCMTDADAEKDLSDALPDLPPAELALFHKDIQIIERGIYCDREAIELTIKKIQENENALNSEIQQITRGQVSSATQTEVFRLWLWNEGLKLPDVKKYTLEDALKLEGLPEYLKRAIAIRQAVSMTSVAKMGAMLEWSCLDGRIRGTLMYHGASTGRWTGKGIQPQNLPRNAFYDTEFNEFLNSDTWAINMFHGSVQEAASRALRGMLCAAPGNLLLAADLSGIESRVVAWLACDENKLNVFREGKDPYLYAAMAIYGKSYEELEAAKKAGNCPERKIGKVVELACGYQGWTGAFASMAGNYGVNVPDEEAEKAIRGWRAQHPAIEAFWYGLIDAAVRAVKTRKECSYGRIMFFLKDKWLCMRLPSGRLLYYFDPVAVTKPDRYDRMRDTVEFWGYKTEKGGTRRIWMKLDLYGGLLAENATQAVARDIIVSGIWNAEQAGYPVIFHVHDEIVAEIPEGPEEYRKYHVKNFESLLCKVPTWAEGLPLGAEGWCGKRYRK